MAKTNKKTRETQYTEILAKLNKTLAQCSVLGFMFRYVKHAHAFHFYLMENHVEYLLFDLTENGNAIVVIARESEQADKIRAFAQQADGIEYKPNLRMETKQ